MHGCLILPKCAVKTLKEQILRFNEIISATKIWSDPPTVFGVATRPLAMATGFLVGRLGFLCLLTQLASRNLQRKIRE